MTRRRPPGRPGRGARRGLLAALAAGLACYAVMLGIAAAHRQGAPRNVGLTAWLTRHHLTSGFAPYWEASSITVDSGGAITLLSVTDGGWHGHVAPQKWLTDTLLTKKMPTATFVIVSPAEKVRRASAVATFGQPAQDLPLRPLHDPGVAAEPGAADAARGQAAGHASRERHPPRRDLGSLVGLLGLAGFTGLAGLARPFAGQDRDDRAEHAQLDSDVRDVH